MQTIVLHLVFQDLKPRLIDKISPWVDSAPRPIQDLRNILDAQTHRRVLKSHLPLDGFYYRTDDKIVVVEDRLLFQERIVVYDTDRIDTLLVTPI